MPATLGHIGVQYLLSRGIIRDAAPKWILLGCVLPDLPWIAQRLVRGLMGVSPIDMRLYAIAQSSLIFCLVLAAALALFSRHSARVFGILALGVVIHLLLDATQIKWGNGVVLWAPVHWNITRFDLFWPEQWPSLALLCLGLVIALWLLLRSPPEQDDLRRPGWMGWLGLIFCGGAYILGPWVSMPHVARADLHFAATIASPETRPGRPIEIDRNQLTWADGQAQLVTWFDETLHLTGQVPREDGKISLRGHFGATNQIEITDVYTHGSGLRDGASIAGLAFVLFWWGRVLWRRRVLL